MKNTILKLGTLALLPGLYAAAAAPAHAQVSVAVQVGPVQVRYDSLGIPIWGYGRNGRAIYAYDPAGLPIYAFDRVYSGCYVPDWTFQPCYHGPRWPHGIHMRPHGFRPALPPPPRHRKPAPKHRKPAPHGPAPGAPHH